MGHLLNKFPTTGEQTLRALARYPSRTAFSWPGGSISYQGATDLIGRMQSVFMLMVRSALMKVHSRKSSVGDTALQKSEATAARTDCERGTPAISCRLTRNQIAPGPTTPKRPRAARIETHCVNGLVPWRKPAACSLPKALRSASM